MRATLVSLAATALLAGCGSLSDYEAAVQEEEPVYCYRSLGGVSCFEAPHHRDQRRLVNYYGPAPERYEAPEPAAPARLEPPPAVGYYVRDAEPVPRPRPRGDTGDRPWLSPAAAAPAGPVDAAPPAAPDVPPASPAGAAGEPPADPTPAADGT